MEGLSPDAREKWLASEVGKLAEENDRLRDALAYLLEVGEPARSGTITQRAWAFVQDEHASGERAARFEGYALARMPG